MIDIIAYKAATGAVLLQQYDDGLHPIVYYNSKYAQAERNGGGEKKLLAIF